MLKLLLRCVFFIVGIVMLFDGALPTRIEQLHVDQHTSQPEHYHYPANGSNSATGRWVDASYTLHFIGGQPASCSVGYSAYTTLQDGDAVEVQSTHLFKNCIRISRSEDVIFFNKYWKIFMLIGGCVLIIAAIGWLEIDEDGSVSIF